MDLSNRDIAPWQGNLARHRKILNVIARAMAAGISLALLIAAPETAPAATSTGNLTVQVTITAGCSVSGTTLNFGSNNGNNLLAAQITATANLSVTCTTGSPYSVGLDNGLNASGSQRRMQSSGQFLNYNLFTDAAGLVPWSAGSTPTTCATLTNCVLGTGTGTAQTITVYGRIPITASSPAPGSYTDTVTITVTY